MFLPPYSKLHWPEIRLNKRMENIWLFQIRFLIHSIQCISEISYAKHHAYDPWPQVASSRGWKLDKFVDSNVSKRKHVYIRGTECYGKGQWAYEKMFNITNHQGNANQNHTEMLSHTCKDGHYQKNKRQQVLTSIRKNWNPCTSLVGTQNGATAMENSIEVPQKIKNKITMWLSNPTLGHLFKRFSIKISKRYRHSYVYWSFIHSNRDM